MKKLILKYDTSLRTNNAYCKYGFLPIDILKSIIGDGIENKDGCKNGRVIRSATITWKVKDKCLINVIKKICEENILERKVRTIQSNKHQH